MTQPKLQKIAENLRNNISIEEYSTRDLLGWFDAKRRGPNIVMYIRDQLEESGLRTVPDFESAWIDGPIDFEIVEHESASIEDESTEIKESAEEIIAQPVEPPVSWIGKDPTYRVSKLKAANQHIVSVTADETIQKAITLMMEEDFSQLPVMNGEFSVKGMISWKTIGRGLGLGKKVGMVKEFMEPHHEIRSDLSIFDAISAIVAFDYVLVRADNNKITGIVTSSDLSSQFHLLSEPFLLLSEIENLVRNIIGNKFTASDLAMARDPNTVNREVKNVADLTFGEYIRLVQNETRWNKLGIAIDRKVFCEKLDNVRNIRNDVVHFDPDGIDDDDLRNLRKFTGLLKQLDSFIN